MTGWILFLASILIGVPGLILLIHASSWQVAVAVTLLIFSNNLSQAKP